MVCGQERLYNKGDKMKRYSLWNKKDEIITPTGEIFTAEQWIERYPVAGLDKITVVCSAGEINGGFFGTLGQMKQMYADMGADFSSCVNDEDILNIIEAFEDSQNTADNTPTAEERIAAALEYQVMVSLPDEEVEVE